MRFVFPHYSFTLINSQLPNFIQTLRFFDHTIAKMATKTKSKILAISGSLRANSSNNAIINSAAQLVYGAVDFIIYEGLGNLPHFNDSKDPAAEVIEFRSLLQEADGILICSPEYAF